MLTGPVGAQGSMCGAAASSDREEMPTSIHARRSSPRRRKSRRDANSRRGVHADAR